MDELLPKVKAEKMVKVRINMTSVNPAYDISMGCAEDESLSDADLQKKTINVARERQKFLNQILQAGEEIEVPESIAKAWEAETYSLPTGIFGVINSSQLGVTPPRLLDGMDLKEYNRQVEEFGKLVNDKISIKVSRATIIGK